MLLAMDIGNTNVKIGIFKGDELAYTWRVSTVASHTADEYGMVIYDLLRQGGHTFEDVDGAVMSSVAPSLNYTIEHMCSYYTGKRPIVVDHRTRTGIELCYDNPSELGADRMVGAAAAYRFYGGPVIEVDFGSATTFNLVTAEGKFIGGAIAPGVKTATESLVHTAAKLVKYMVAKYRTLPEMKGAKVVATGGLSELIAGVEPELIDITDRALALKGLKYIYDLNRAK